MKNIVGVGNSCFDYLCMVDRFPHEDESVKVQEIVNQGGGAVATALTTVSTLGVKSSFIGVSGDDMVGHEIEKDFIKYGVNIDNLDKFADEKSLVSFVFVNKLSGLRTKFPLVDNSQDILWTDSKIDIISNADILHLDGTQYNNAVNAANIANSAGVLVSLDGSTRQLDDNDKNLKLAKMADILIMNSVYPKKIMELDCLNQSLLEIGKWDKKVVVSTIGDQGVLSYENGEIFHYSPYQVEVVDTTGAGDVFHGAFLTAYVEGKELEYCINFAQTCAALKCLKVGGRQGVLSYDEVYSHMQNHNFIKTKVL